MPNLPGALHWTDRKDLLIVDVVVLLPKRSMVERFAGRWSQSCSLTRSHE